jgi:ankyrin repeat protein
MRPLRPRGTDAIPLPPRPQLEQYRKRAKGLVKACQSSDPDAIRAWARAWIGALADAAAIPTADETRARRLGRREVDNEVDRVIKDAVACDLPATQTATEPCTLADAQLFIARLHDFESWPKFAAHVEALTRVNSPNAVFEAAADAVVTGNERTLQSLLESDSSLVRARSARDHRATLLHYIAANGHEGYRQITPPNAVTVARMLLEAGAEPDAHAHMYGGDATTMDMLVSSVHPANAGVQVALVDLLVDFGAAVNGVADNGSPVMTALAFGYPDAAAALARRGARIDNVISAAALGRVETVARLVTEDGRLRPDAPLAAVRWPRLRKDPQVHLEFALTWAAAYGHRDVVQLLLERGVSAHAADNDLPALHAAAARGHLDIVRLLLDHGASLETLNSYGGTVLGSTLWFAYNSPVEGVRYPDVIRFLVDAGANVDAGDGLRKWVDDVLARGGSRGQVS